MEHLPFPPILQGVFMSIQIKTIVSIPFEENSFVIWHSGKSECVVIDPGLSPEEILDFLQKEQLVPVSLFCTHGHADHIGGIGAIRKVFPHVPIVVGEKDAVKLTDARQNLSADFGIPVTAPAADILLEETTPQTPKKITYAGMEWDVYSTPGHSAGHVVYLLREKSPMVAFVGDLIFYHSVGRTDFFDGSFTQLERSIRQVLYTLPDDTILYPGHGPSTTVGVERKTNPFVSE